jgi:hypothetical protein
LVRGFTESGKLVLDRRFLLELRQGQGRLASLVQQPAEVVVAVGEIPLETRFTAISVG